MTSHSWEQIEQIFLQAADLPREEQAAFLDLSCGPDQELRREVQSLLDSDHKSAEKITRAVENEALDLFGLSPILGSRLGAYRVVREIGRGGMGAVYLAVRDDEQFQKDVAIKLVKRGMDTAEVLRRFQHEREILAGLDHAYIARLLDAGTATDGRPFFVMEYVEGQPIDTYCRINGLSVAARCRLFLKACEAVSHAHRNLVIHRDLKPGNIFVGPDGSPKLLDFGVAKLLTADAGHQITVTQVESRLLTPQYASPEQVMGRPVNTATDVYSLGAVFYELLTGVCAQPMDSTSREEIERVICIQDTLPPSSVKPGLPSDLDNIVMKAMRKDVARRYQSVDQFAEDIERYLDGRPILARKDSLTYRAGKFIRRNRLPLAAAVLVLASLVGGIVIAMSQARRAEQRLQEMVELANRSLFDVHTAIERLPGSTEARRAIVKTTLEFLEHLSKDAGRDDRLRMPLAAAYYRLGDLQGYQYKPNLGDSRGALESYNKAAVMIEPLFHRHPNDPEILDLYVDIYNHMGTTYSALNSGPETIKAFQTALPAALTLSRLLPDDKNANQQYAELYNELAEAVQYSDPDKAYQYAQKHLEISGVLMKKFPGNDDIIDDAADAHARLFTVFSRRGELQQALAEAKECVRLREMTTAAHPNDQVRLRGLMLGYGHIAGLLGWPLVMNLGDPKGALEYYAKCVSIARRIVQSDPEDRTGQYDLAAALLRQGSVDVPREKIPEALAALRESIRLLESLYRADPAIRFPRELTAAYEFAGYRLRALGRQDEALDQLLRAVSLGNAELAKHPGDAPLVSVTVKVEGEVAAMLAARGDPSGALAHAKHGLSIAQETLNGPEHPIRMWYLATAYFYLARTQRALGKWDDAHETIQKTLATMNSPDTRIAIPSRIDEANALLAEITAHQRPLKK